jgi:hypothetical protein
MKVSQLKQRLMAITVALVLTLSVNTAISYAAREITMSTVETELRSGGTSTIPTDTPRPRSGGTSTIPTDTPRPRSGGTSTIPTDTPRP